MSVPTDDEINARIARAMGPRGHMTVSDEDGAILTLVRQFATDPYAADAALRWAVEVRGWAVDIVVEPCAGAPFACSSVYRDESRLAMGAPHHLAEAPTWPRALAYALYRALEAEQ